MLRRIFIASLVVAAATASAALADAPATQAADPTTAPAGELFAPMAYFEQSCARCHGPGGSWYGETFGSNGVANLRATVSMMANGPAQAPIADAALDRLVAYHRSLISKTPFVAVTQLPTGGERKMKGEISASSTLKVEAGKHEIPAKVEGATFTVDVPAGTDVHALTLTATRDGKTTRLELGKGLYSHAGE